MGLWKLEGREGQGWDSGCLEGRGRRWGEGAQLPFKARRPLGAASTATATSAARSVQDPGARAAGAPESGFPGPPCVSGMLQHRDGNVEAVTRARIRHWYRVAQKRAAKFRSVSKSLAGRGEVWVRVGGVQIPWGQRRDLRAGNSHL